jgi:flagellar motor switch protein FliG
MGVYARYKKNPEGLRDLVSLLESASPQRRQKMIDVGMAEDPAYTLKAMGFMFTFADILELPDPELAEVICETPAPAIALAIGLLDPAVKKRFLVLTPKHLLGAVREALDSNTSVTESQAASAQRRLIESARKLEKQGLVKTKRITYSG